MLITCEEMRRAEEAAFARGVQAEDLMEQAGRGVAEIVRQFHRVPGLCMVFCGKGHNAGDALVAARYLASWGGPSTCDLRLGRHSGPAHREKLDQLGETRRDLPSGNSTVILDGLLGLGAKGEPRGEIALAIQSINRLKQERGAWVFAIDIPSGLDGVTGAPASICVTADLTATIAVAKDCLVADAATAVVGRLAIIELEELPQPKSADGILPPPDPCRRGCLLGRSICTRGTAEGWALLPAHAASQARLVYAVQRHCVRDPDSLLCFQNLTARTCWRPRVFQK